MTCRLLVLRDGLASVVDYWTATRASCLEMADLWRWSCECSVWLEWGVMR